MTLALPGLSFLYPHTLWLIVLLPLIWWRPGRVTPLHRGIRTAIFACVIAALAQPAVILPAGQARRIVILDQRDSLSPEARARARTALDRLLVARDRGRTTLIQLGGTRVPGNVDDRIEIASARDAASLPGVLQRALAGVPLGAGGTITLISDGLSSDRHWTRAVEAIARRGIPIDTIALERAERAALISDVDIQPVRAGETANATITVDGTGNDLRAALYAGDRLLARTPVFAVRGTTRVAAAFPATAAGFHPITVMLEGTQSQMTAHVPVQDPVRLLYAGQPGGADLLQKLLGQGFAVNAGPVAKADPARYAAVILDDVSPVSLAPDVQARLVKSIAVGGTGLLYGGGDAAFDFPQTVPLAAVLPIVPKPEEKVQQPSVALAIVIDSSGSMQGNPLEIAKQVARVTVRKLGSADSVGVVEFYGAKQWAVPMQPARSIPDVERAIGRMQANGASVLYPAIEEAYYALKAVDARFKHLLIISDAGVEEQRYEPLLRHIADDRINVSTALVGTDLEGEERMAQWARWGRGRFYSVPDETSLVEMNFKIPEIKPQSGMRRGGFSLTVGRDNGWLRGMASGALPPIDGYVRTTARPQAETLVRTASGDPVLASWQVGNGRVTALMTQMLGAGTAGWRNWTRYGEWLGRVVARTANQQPPIELRLSREGDRLTIVAQRLSGGQHADPVVRLMDAAGGGPDRIVAMDEKAPGLFVGVTMLAPNRPALVEANDGVAVVRAADRAGSDVASPDAMPLASALPLARASAATGGVHLADPGAPLPDRKQASGDDRAVPFWSWLSLFALLLYLGELLYRRWPGRRSPVVSIPRL
jgi:hypothetical protein